LEMAKLLMLQMCGLIHSGTLTLQIVDLETLKKLFKLRGLNLSMMPELKVK
jgi:hypothetical protein